LKTTDFFEDSIKLMNRSCPKIDKEKKSVSSQDPCFELENVCFAWPGKHPVLDRQSVRIPKGGFILVRGRSGAGKSTLLRLMNRLEEVDAGEIRYQGQAITAMAPARLRQQVAFLQQTPVVPDLSVRQILLSAFAFRINKDKTPPGDEALLAMLDWLDLGRLGLGDSGTALSGGQRQRLCLLRALIIGPEVLLLDEPTSSLDRDSKKKVEQVAVQACRDGKTIVMITHDDFVPDGVCVYEMTIDRGKVTLCQ
jgi:putative ABC transport system ATP-binding protein